MKQRERVHRIGSWIFCEMGKCKYSVHMKILPKTNKQTNFHWHSVCRIFRDNFAIILRRLIYSMLSSIRFFLHAELPFIFSLKAKNGWKYCEYEMFWLHIIIIMRVCVLICLAVGIWGWPNFICNCPGYEWYILNGKSSFFSEASLYIYVFRDEQIAIVCSRIYLN